MEGEACNNIFGGFSIGGFTSERVCLKENTISQMVCHVVFLDQSKLLFHLCGQWA